MAKPDMMIGGQLYHLSYDLREVGVTALTSVDHVSSMPCRDEW